MKNVNVHVNSHTLVIEVDLTQDFGPSSSGKTAIVASSEGSKMVPGHEAMRFGLNVFKFAPKK